MSVRFVSCKAVAQGKRYAHHAKEVRRNEGPAQSLRLGAAAPRQGEPGEILGRNRVEGLCVPA